MAFAAFDKQLARCVGRGRHRCVVIGGLRVAVDVGAVHLVTVAAAAAPAIAPASALALAAVVRFAAVGVGLGVNEGGRRNALRSHRGVGCFSVAGRSALVASAMTLVATAVVARFLARFGARTAAIAAIASIAAPA